MADASYTPPKVWAYDSENGGVFAGINRPTAGARHDKELPVGDHPFQLYSLGTPNGQKVTIMFEELLAAGFSEAEYDAWMINIRDGEQFGSGFTALNPNGKIPALEDRSGPAPFRVFESGAILLHLAEKFDFLLPRENPARAEVLSWLMWQMGTAPFIGGGFGHFYAYAPEKYQYPINRYAMETKRIFSVAISTSWSQGCSRQSSGKRALRGPSANFFTKHMLERHFSPGRMVSEIDELGGTGSSSPRLKAGHQQLPGGMDGAAPSCPGGVWGPRAGDYRRIDRLGRPRQARSLA